jgi:F-type H+-transporting ATPase subunit b
MRRCWVLFGLVVLLLGFVMTAPARAADEPAAHGTGEPAASGHGSEGHDAHSTEDQGLFGKALDLGIWTVVVFLVLLWVLSKYAWGPMLQGLQKREQNIQDALDRATQAQKEAERLREQHQREMDKVQEQVAAILDNARRASERSTDEMIAKARSEIQSERDRLRREIDNARDQAVQQLWNQTAQLATLVSAKAIRRQLTPDDHRRLLDEALADLGPAGDAWQRQTANLRS